MPIIKPTEKLEKEQIRLSIKKSIAENVRQYCAWIGMSKPDDFYEQAAEFVLTKDKDWLNYLSELSQKTTAAS